ncbi:MAG: hypothetical protein JO092_01640 [Candidatus Eremiobacteraeota bacterium]|nr:hypothetical protein [Candidatus Eremiobacteraeota bacterium]
MTLRQTPGALVLGLVAALVGHAALFGGEHAIGGAYHSLLLQVAAAAGFGFGGALGALLWSGARFAADGSVLATRIAAHLPGLPGVAVSTALWFSLGERLEPHHAGTPLAFALVALLGAAALILGIARALVRWIAHIAFAISRAKTCGAVVRARADTNGPVFRAQRDATGRRFARPPPIVANARA